MTRRKCCRILHRFKKWCHFLFKSVSAHTVASAQLGVIVWEKICTECEKFSCELVQGTAIVFVSIVFPSTEEVQRVKTSQPPYFSFHMLLHLPVEIVIVKLYVSVNLVFPHSALLKKLISYAKNIR